MPVISAMLEITTELFERIFNADTQRKLAAARVAEETGAGAAMAREQGWFRGRKFFQLDINYRWSPVVFDERFPNGESTRAAYGEPDRDVRAGDRAPDAPLLVDGKATRLFDIFDPARHTLLLFGIQKGAAMFDVLCALPAALINVLEVLPAGSEQAQPSHSVVNLLVEDKDGHARKGYILDGYQGPIVVVVRPDGMVGAFATSANGLDQYFSSVFSRA